MRVINCIHIAIIKKRELLHAFAWNGNKFVKNGEKFLSFVFECPLCNYINLFQTEEHDDSLWWRVKCANCNKVLRLNNED